MSRITRRTLFKRTSLGAAVVGALLAAPHAIGARAEAAGNGSDAPRGSADSVLTSPATSEPVVAYVRDSAKGEIAIFVGTQEIIRHDPQLVARLLQAGA